MALPSSGPISFSSLQAEFGGSNPISLSEYYRNKGYVTNNNTGVPTTGYIQLDDFYNSERQFALTISSNITTGANLRSLALAAGWDGTSSLICYNTAIISSNDTSVPALTISGSFPRGIEFHNSGFIVGMGGAGAPPEQAGRAGGTALLVSSNVIIENTGTMAGGGGGGGAGVSWGWNGLIRSCSGSGGGSGLTQTPGTANYYGFGSSYPSQDANADGLYETGGPSYVWGYGGRVSSPGGKGGNWGTAGDAGGTVDGNYNYSGYAGGAAGKSVQGNSFITWIATGTRIGPIA